MRARLIAKADAGDALCLIHVNKVLGWSERLVVEEAPAELNLREMTDEAIEQRIMQLRRRPAPRLLS